MKNLVIVPFALAAVMFFGSCQADDPIIIDDTDQVPWDFPVDIENENDLPTDNDNTDTSGFYTTVSGFNSIEISNFTTTTNEGNLIVSFDAQNDITDQYTFIVYNFETRESIDGFKLRGGASSYEYTVRDLPTETPLLLWGWFNRGFGQEYLGGVWVNIPSNI